MLSASFYVEKNGGGGGAAAGVNTSLLSLFLQKRAQAQKRGAIHGYHAASGFRPNLLDAKAASSRKPHRLAAQMPTDSTTGNLLSSHALDSSQEGNPRFPPPPTDDW